MKRRAAWAVVLLFCAAEARAQNLREVPQGGRTATMGGVGVAAGTDAAMPLLNPAGVAGTPTDMLSVSADVYSYTSIKIPRYFRPNGVDAGKFGNVTGVSDEDYSVSELDSTPSGVAYFARLGPPEDPGLHVLGVSFTVQSYLLYTETGSFGATTSNGNLREDVVVAQQFTEYLVGPTYAVKVADGVRLGLSVLATYGHATSDHHDNVVFTQVTNGVASPNSENTRTRLDASSFGVTAIAGVQARVAPNTWIGGAFESLGIPIYGNGDLLQNSDLTAVDPKAGQQAAHQNTHITFKDFQIRRPFRASLGAAYEVPKSWAIGADVHAWLPQKRLIHSAYSGDALAFQTGQPPATAHVDNDISVDSQLTFNGSIGVEYFFTDKLAVRGGVASDKDITTDTARDGSKNSRLDWYVWTLGLGSYEGIFETTYGAAFRYGVGTRYVPDHFNTANPVGVDFTGWGLMLVLSGSVKLEKDEPEAKKAARR
jgi:long-subunit fatty acid transport protein